MPGWVEVAVGLLVVGSQLAAHVVAAQKKKQAAAALADAAGKAVAAPQAGSGTPAMPQQQSLRALLETAQKRQGAAQQARSPKAPVSKPRVQVRATAQAQPHVEHAPTAPVRKLTQVVVPAAQGPAAPRISLRLPRSKRDWVIASEVLGRPRCESF